MQKNVLIIEDEIFISMVLEQTFNNFGFNVLEVIRYGEEVLEKLTEMDPKPDLITMDIHLAGEQTGTQTTGLINEKFPDIPIIYLTAYSDTATERDIKKTNYVDIMYKPFENSQLEKILQKVFPDEAT